MHAVPQRASSEAVYIEHIAAHISKGAARKLLGQVRQTL